MTQLKRLDLNLFKVFDAIYRERNLTRAAARLSVTQPAVSNALARLRDSLGDPLFVKTSAGMQPTAYADSAFGQVSSALMALDSIASQGKGFQPQQSKRIFNIYLLNLHEVMILPRLMAKIETVAANIKLRTIKIPRADQKRALASGALDLASNIPLQDTGELVTEILAEEEYVCAVRPGHPALDQDLTLERYLGLRHLQVSDRHLGQSAVDIMLRRQGLRRETPLMVQSYLSALETVRCTDMALTSSRTWVESTGLVALPLPLEVPPLKIQLYRHAQTRGDAAIDWIFDQIIETSRAVF